MTDARRTEPEPPARSTNALGGPAFQRGILAGLALAALVGLVAIWLGTLAPVIGGPVIGILLGVALRSIIGSRPVLAPGVRFASKIVLQAAVVLLGAGLSLGQVARTGWGALPVMLGTIAVALAGTALVGRRLGIGRETRTLIGVGTGICGASAIATVSAVIGASELAVAVSMTTIFVFNVLAVLLFPLLGHLMSMSQDSFGLWAGTAINDTSSVVAAATVYGAAATSYAVIVKLTRTLMIIPISIGLAIGKHRRDNSEASGADHTGMPWRKMVPTFLVLFIIIAALNTVGGIPSAWHGAISWTATYFITVALTGVGLSTPIDTLRRSGWRPFALGGILWALVATSSLGLQAAIGQL